MAVDYVYKCGCLFPVSLLLLASLLLPDSLLLVSLNAGARVPSGSGVLAVARVSVVAGTLSTRVLVTAVGLKLWDIAGNFISISNIIVDSTPLTTSIPGIQAGSILLIILSFKCCVRWMESRPIYCIVPIMKMLIVRSFNAPKKFQQMSAVKFKLKLPVLTILHRMVGSYIQYITVSAREEIFFCFLIEQNRRFCF